MRDSFHLSELHTHVQHRQEKVKKSFYGATHKLTQNTIIKFAISNKVWCPDLRNFNIILFI